MGEWFLLAPLCLGRLFPKGPVGWRLACALTHRAQLGCAFRRTSSCAHRPYQGTVESHRLVPPVPSQPIVPLTACSGSLRPCTPESHTGPRGRMGSYTALYFACPCHPPRAVFLPPGPYTTAIVLLCVWMFCGLCMVCAGARAWCGVCVRAIARVWCGMECVCGVLGSFLG